MASTSFAGSIRPSPAQFCWQDGCAILSPVPLHPTAAEASSDPGPSRMLAGTKVLDLSVWRPGPYATSLLCHLGADVIKVEPPGGDPMRIYPELFAAVNAGKRSVVLDLKDPADRDQAWALAGEADVLVEGFRPGIMARFGLDADTVRRSHAGLVYCSISGYGQQSERAQWPGHDLNYQAWAGTLSPEGRPANMPPLPIADLASGVTAAMGICAALLGRAQHGLGTYLDVSMTNVLGHLDRRRLHPDHRQPGATRDPTGRSVRRPGLRPVCHGRWTASRPRRGQ